MQSREKGHVRRACGAIDLSGDDLLLIGKPASEGASEITGYAVMLLQRIQESEFGIQNKGRAYCSIK